MPRLIAKPEHEFIYREAIARLAQTVSYIDLVLMTDDELRGALKSALDTMRTESEAESRSFDDTVARQRAALDAKIAGLLEAPLSASVRAAR